MALSDKKVNDLATALVMGAEAVRKSKKTSYNVWSNGFMDALDYVYGFDDAKRVNDAAAELHDSVKQDEEELEKKVTEKVEKTLEKLREELSDMGVDVLVNPVKLEKESKYVPSGYGIRSSFAPSVEQGESDESVSLIDLNARARRGKK